MRMAGAVAPSTVSALALLSGVEGVVPQESKEGDDVYPPDRVESVVDTAVRNSKPKVAEKEKSGKSGRGKNNGDDLEGLLAEVGLKDLRDESDDSFDEYEVVPMPKSSKKKVRALCWLIGSLKIAVINHFFYFSSKFRVRTRKRK